MKASYLAGLAAAALLAGALPSAVAAKDVCVSDGDGRDYRFESPKLPKKPGKITTLLGSARLVPAAVDAFAFGPIQGSAMLVSSVGDAIIVSVFGQTANIPFSVRAVVDRDFAGQGLGAFGPGASLDTEFTWTRIDCDASALP
ncbi:MAG TPA: hypothetical protein VNE71_07005 [Myxococcota bacterium]|nr:hypothetical protein [Myxococcota bacterium]